MVCDVNIDTICDIIILFSACPQINDVQPFLSLKTLMFTSPFVLSATRAATSAKKYVLAGRKHKRATLDTTRE